MTLTSAAGSALTGLPQPLSPEELRNVHAYWRAANYLAFG
jgi:phosphoketolase